ncbi:MAG: response regulator, partial [Pseudomonadota bacterium]
MRILVVEDEAPLRQQIVNAVKAGGHIVDECGDGEEALHIGLDYPIDLAILDLGLPAMDGLEILNLWRRRGRHFPVLILTARGRWQEKVDGLEAGADDYLVKPFHIEEVLARVRALARRAAGHAQATITVGNIHVDTSRQEVRVDRQPVELTAFEYRLLETLAMNSGKVVSKLELTERLYPDDEDRDSNVLEVLVGRL